MISLNIIIFWRIVITQYAYIADYKEMNFINKTHCPVCCFLCLPKPPWAINDDIILKQEGVGPADNRASTDLVFFLVLFIPQQWSSKSVSIWASWPSIKKYVLSHIFSQNLVWLYCTQLATDFGYSGPFFPSATLSYKPFIQVKDRLP